MNDKEIAEFLAEGVYSGDVVCDWCEMEATHYLATSSFGDDWKFVCEEDRQLAQIAGGQGVRMLPNRPTFSNRLLNV